MDPILFQEAIDAVALNKGVSHEAVVEALKEAIERAYIKHLGGGDDAEVEVSLDEEKGFVTVAQLKKVTSNIQDDYLEIDPEDAKEEREMKIDDLTDDIAEAKKDKKLKEKVPELQHLLSLVEAEDKNIVEGGKYRVYCPLEDLTKITAMSIKSLFRQKIAEAERVALYDIYKDHIGEMMTGIVEKADDRSATINIGRTNVDLSRREMIGDEFFRVGDTVKVYLQEVRQTGEQAPNAKAPKGPQIMITRASDGFLKRLFEEEIHEVYDGTVLIKGVAREAGVRSKVSVESTNPDVDPTGACIGQGGQRIQKIVQQLGNAKEKEKIDIISYSSNPALYVAESLRPAHVVGVKLLPLREPTEEEPNPRPEAIAIVRPEEYSLAIGKKGANARLADRLTGYSIKILDENDAERENIDFVSVETLEAEVEAEKKAKEREEYAKKSLEEASARKSEAASQVEESPVLPELSAEEEEEYGEEEKAAAEEKVASAEPASEVPEEKPALEEAKEPEPEPVKVEEPVKEPAKPVEVKTTTTLESLERDLLESSKRKEESDKKPRWNKAKRPHQISEKEVARPAANELPKEAMPIYSQEELEQIAKEEEENAQNDYDEDDLLDEYDNDAYYEDK